MTAANPHEFRARHGAPSTPDRMADWLRMCLDTRRDGKCDGVVTYCLDKRLESRAFPTRANRVPADKPLVAPVPQTT